MKKLKMPKTLGATIDLLYTLREERKAFDAQSKAVKEQEDAVEAYLQANFAKDHLAGAKGSLASVSFNPTTVPDVVDWDAFYAYVSRHKAWDLLQKRVSSTACNERWAAKKVIAGVEPKELLKMSLNKLSAAKPKAATKG